MGTSGPRLEGRVQEGERDSRLVHDARGHGAQNLDQRGLRVRASGRDAPDGDRLVQQRGITLPCPSFSDNLRATALRGCVKRGEVTRCGERSARGEIRTRTGLPPVDFESTASAVPPLGPSGNIAPVEGRGKRSAALVREPRGRHNRAHRLAFPCNGIRCWWKGTRSPSTTI
jgi:hypothetical protein